MFANAGFPTSIQHTSRFPPICSWQYMTVYAVDRFTLEDISLDTKEMTNVRLPGIPCLL
jgi:hypothetical protein